MLSRVGASDRDRANVPRPRPVWVDVTGHWYDEKDWRPGLLLEWRSIATRQNTVRWEGLVVWASGGGELPWSVSQGWVRSGNVRPMYPADPWHVEGSPPTR